MFLKYFIRYKKFSRRYKKKAAEKKKVFTAEIKSLRANSTIIVNWTFFVAIVIMDGEYNIRIYSFSTPTSPAYFFIYFFLGILSGDVFSRFHTLCASILFSRSLPSS